MTENAEHWDGIYKKPLFDIPWEIAAPPKELAELVETKTLIPGKALDIACGSGNYSIYLAENGFGVTGVDFSERAIALAKKKALKSGLSINFLEADVLGLGRLFPKERFDLVLDYSLMHHIAPADIKSYAAQATKVLKPGGKLLLVCYSEGHKRAQGHGSARGKHGNIMYFRARKEIEKIYKGLKEISYKSVRLGKEGKHPAHCFLFEKV